MPSLYAIHPIKKMRLRWTSKLEKFLHDSNFPCGNVAFDLKTSFFVCHIRYG